MFSLLKNNKKLLSVFAFIIFFSTIAFLYFQPSFENRLAKAENLLADWQLSKSLNLTKSLLAEKPEDINIKELYGKVLFNMGELFESRKVFKELILKQNSNNIKNKFYLAFTYYYLGKPDSAKILLEEISKQTDLKKNPVFYSRLLNLNGLIAFNNAKYIKAKYLQTKSLELARENNVPDEKANALRQLGVLTWYSGKFDSVISKFYIPALKLYQSCGDKKGEATTLSNIGLIYGNREDWFENLKYQLKAFEIRKKINDQIGIADSYYFFTHNMPENDKGNKIAYLYFLKSYKLSSRIGYSWGEEIALRGLKNFRQKAAFKYEYDDAAADSVFNLTPEGKIQNLWRKARNYLKLKNYKSSAYYFKKGIELSDAAKLNVGVENEMLEYAGVLTELNRFAGAHKVIKRAMNIFLTLPRPMGYAESLYALAKLNIKKGNKNSSAKIFSKLVNFYDSLYISKLNSVNPSIAFETALRSIHSMRYKIYDDYFDLLISLKKYKETFELVEKERHLPFFGNYKNSEENNYLLTDIESLIKYVDKTSETDIKKTENLLKEINKKILLKRNKNSNLYSNYLAQEKNKYKQIKKAISKNDVLLEYFINRENVYTFVIKKDKFKLIKLDINADQLASIADVFREAILFGKKDTSNNLWKAPARNLYNILIKPLIKDSLLNNTNNLIISADQFVHFIPFNALLNNEKGKENFMVEKYNISYIPSAGFFAQKRLLKHRQTKNILAFAPETGSLPFTEKEVEIVKNIRFANVKIFLGDKASTSNLFLHADNYDIIHIASHGEFNADNPFQSEINFSDRNIKLNELLGLKLKSKLIVLSACETGLSAGELVKYPRGPDLISFTRAFISAGASSVISPLWLVEDKSTSELIRLFYKYLLIYRDKNIPNIYAFVLNSAQREFIADSRKKGEYNHPFYWAGFYIMGYNN